MVRDRVAPAAYLIITALFVLLAYPTLVWLVQTWLSNPYYTHGFLIPPLAAFFAWRRWHHLQEQPRQSEPLAGLLVALVGLTVVVWSTHWLNHAFAALALVALLTGILLYLEGWSRVRQWLFPLGFLAFMVPWPFIDQASPWLESFTAHWATLLAKFAGIAALQQGGEITLPNAAVTVGAPCSGLRSLVSMVTLGVGWIYVVEGRGWAKVLMLAAAVPIVAMSNVLRIALLLVVAALLGEDAALSYYHDWSSPILFLLALALFLVWGRILGCSRVRDDIW